MQPRDLHRPRSVSACASCLQGSCLVFLLSLVYVVLRAQPSEGASVVFKQVPPLKPVARQPVLAPSSLEEPEARPPKNWLPHRPATRERADTDPQSAPPARGPLAGPQLPEPQNAVTSAPVQTPPARWRGGGASGRSRPSQSPPQQASSLPTGVRLLSPPSKVYLEHLAYMEKHPANGKTHNIGDWMKNIGGYHRPEAATPDAELLAIMKQSGWRDADTPLGLEVPGARASAAPVLTGNAWHHGRDRCPEACTDNGGVCLPALGRCDCPRHRWGPVCEQLVQPAVARPGRYNGWCVYNDADPWMCDKPVCTRAQPLGAKLGGARAQCRGAAPLEECPGGCNDRGVCERGRCACYPHWSGHDCTRQSTAHHCISDCTGRGDCDTGFCRCHPPYYGVDCSLAPMPPPPGPASAGSPPPPSLPRGHLGVVMGPPGPPAAPCVEPCVYVYELPARMNVLALKAEPHYPLFAHGPADYRAFTAMHVALLRSAHRTADPRKASFFYVPLWDFHGSWGNPEVYWRGLKYVRTHFPFWNASGGADHIVVNTRDAGACSTPWGSIWRETANAMVFSNWGGVTGLGGAPGERCFDARKDVVLPGVLKGRVVERSPFLPFYEQLPAAGGAGGSGGGGGGGGGGANSSFVRLLPGAGGAMAAAARAAAEAAAPWARRKTLLFFHGSLCWQTYDHVRGMRALERKCKQTHGFLDRYSFNVRYEAYRRFKDEPRVVLRATDLLPAPKHADLDDLTLSSVFCLCPSGTGWGMRAFHAVALGCIPVIIQDDGSGKYPSVLQAFEGMLLDWSHFSVRLRYSDLPQLPSILRKLEASPAKLATKRAGLAAVLPRLLWRVALPSAVRAKLRGAPDAFDSVMHTLMLRKKYGLRGSRRRVHREAPVSIKRHLL